MTPDDHATPAVPDLDRIWRHYMSTITQEWPPYTRELLEHARALRAEVKELVDNANWLSCVKEDLTLELEGVRADNTRLRAALEDLVWVTNERGVVICDDCGEPKESPSPGTTSLGPCGSCAPLRAALAGPTPAPEAAP